MEPNGVLNFRHRRSPSSDRFLGVFSQPEITVGGGSSVAVADDELNEDEVFWTGDCTEPNRRSNSPTSSGNQNQNRHRLGFRQQENFGILAVLSEDEQKRNLRNFSVLYRKTSISLSSSSSRMIPAIPRPPQNPQEREFSQVSQSVPIRKFHQSAPMNVPVLPKAMAKGNEKKGEFIEVDDDDDGEDEMLPPHEIVARGSAMSPKTTFSVLEGVGRTLKGRDLRQVRNAVWRKTGFLD